MAGAGAGETADTPGTVGVDGALARLDGLALDEHPDVYQDIHAELRAALAEIDDA